MVLDTSLGAIGSSGWRLFINGVDVSLLGPTFSFEWAPLSLDPASPPVQIGSISLAKRDLLPDIIDWSLDGPDLALDNLVEFEWRGSYLVTARIEEVTMTDYDKDTFEAIAIEIQLTDRLRQALEAPTPAKAVRAIAAVGDTIPWYQYCAELLRLPQDANDQPYITDINTTGLDANVNGVVDGYSSYSDNQESPVAFAASVASIRGYSLWCDENEVIQFVEYGRVSDRPTLRLSRAQVLDIAPEQPLDPAFGKLRFTSTFVYNRTKDLDLSQAIYSEQVGVAPSGNTVIVSKGTTQLTDFVGSNGTGIQQETSDRYARRFTMPEGGESYAFIKAEEKVTTTQYTRGSLIQIVSAKSVNRETIPGAGSGLAFAGNDLEEWRLRADGTPTDHIVVKTNIRLDGNQVRSYKEEVISESWNRLVNNQYWYTRRRQVVRGEAEGGFDETLIDDPQNESRAIGLDEIPAPPSAPVTQVLETLTFNGSATYEAGQQGNEVKELSVPGVSQSTAQAYCNMFCMVSGYRRQPFTIERVLFPGDSVRPFTREDIHTRSLIRDAIAITLSEDGEIRLRYTGWNAGTIPAVEFPKRTIPDFEYPAPTFFVVGDAPTPPAIALTLTSIPALTGVVDVPMMPFSLMAYGGTPPYSFSAVGLPAGLSVSGGAIAGTPTASFSGTVTITVTDSVSDTATATVDLSIAATAPAPIPPVRLQIRGVAGGEGGAIAYIVTDAGVSGVGQGTGGAIGLPPPPPVLTSVLVGADTVVVGTDTVIIYA